jgi:hypothetical protein
VARRVASARDIDESPRYAAGKLMLRNAPARTCVMTAPQKYRTSPLPAAIRVSARTADATACAKQAPGRKPRLVHVVAARLGHADPSITLRVYAHVISNQLAEAATCRPNHEGRWVAAVSIRVSKKAPSMIGRGL